MQNIKEQIVSLNEVLQKQLKGNQKIDLIQYIKDMEIVPGKFQASAFIVHGIERVINEQGIEEEREWIRLFDEDNLKIGKVNELKELEFAEEYIQMLEERFGGYFPELGIREDIHISFDEIIKNNKTKQQYQMTEKEIKQYTKENKKNLPKKQQEEEEKENLIDEVMKKKGIPQNRYLTVRTDSNFYQDHPELIEEEGLTFYEDKDGKIKAGYINENGEWESSKAIESSSTSMYNVIDMGQDGEPVEKIVPYQVMDTNGLDTDNDVRDVKIVATIEQGYLSIKEARQGQNGDWSAHEIEVRGRKYNDYEINEATSMDTGKADPDKHTDSYEKLEDTSIAEDGIQYSEMELIEHADEIIEKFQKQGYSREEAINIFNYMIGDKKLTENQAKERVEKEREQRRQREEAEERTPWGDAESRDRRY